MMIDCTALHFGTSLYDLDLDARSQGRKGAGTSAPIALDEIGELLRLIGFMNLILILSSQINIREEESKWDNFIRKTF